MPVHPDDQGFLEIAIGQARMGVTKGAFPSGPRWSVTGRCWVPVATGASSRGAPSTTARRDALEVAGRLHASVYRRATMYTTLSPCDMCTGAILLYGIPRVVIGENRTFRGDGERYLRSRGVEVVTLDSAACVALMREFIAARPDVWNEDIGEQ